MARHRSPGFWRPALLLPGLVVAACAAGGGRSAPTVDGAVLSAGAVRGFEAASVRDGYALYVGRCGNCHTLYPPAHHTEDQWRAQVRHMARRAALDQRGIDDVLAYILSARDAATPR